MMNIRQATFQDVPTLLAFGELMLDEAVNLPSRFNRKTGEKHIKSCIEHGGAWVADGHDGVVGVFLGGISVEWFTGQKIAFDYALFVLEEYRKSAIGKALVQAFMQWAVGHGVSRFQVGTTTGVMINKTVAMYESLGFKQIGTLLEKS